MKHWQCHLRRKTNKQRIKQHFFRKMSKNVVFEPWLFEHNSLFSCFEKLTLKSERFLIKFDCINCSEMRNFPAVRALILYVSFQDWPVSRKTPNPFFVRISPQIAIEPCYRDVNTAQTTDSECTCNHYSGNKLAQGRIYSLKTCFPETRIHSFWMRSKMDPYGTTRRTTWWLNIP